ncbi:MAG: hypothetical protein ACYDCA_05390 [Candidatus Tyrphobacter sp.]
MSSPTAPEAKASGFQGQVPSVAEVVSEVIGSLALAAHAYMDEASGAGDLASAEVAIDVASLAFDRIRERLGAEQRLAIAQLLTETRLAYVRRREA